MEKALRIPLVKQVIYLVKLILNDTKFWTYIVIKRIISLKEKGVKKEKIIELIDTIGKEPMKVIYTHYAVQFFLKVFIEDLLPGIIVAGIIDLAFNLNFRNFVLTLFIATFSMAIIDTASYVKVEKTARKQKEMIKKRVQSLFSEDNS